MLGEFYEHKNSDVCKTLIDISLLVPSTHRRRWDRIVEDIQNTVFEDACAFDFVRVSILRSVCVRNLIQAMSSSFNLTLQLRIFSFQRFNLGFKLLRFQFNLNPGSDVLFNLLQKQDKNFSANWTIRVLT